MADTENIEMDVGDEGISEEIMDDKEMSDDESDSEDSCSDDDIDSAAQIEKIKGLQNKVM